MTKSDHVAICDAVVESLNAADLSQQVIAERSYIPRTERTDSGLAVFVWPAGDSLDLVTRNNIALHELVVAIGLRKPVSSKDDDLARADVDEMLVLIEEMKHHLRCAGDMAGAALIGIEHSPLWDQDALEENHLFLAVPRFTYRGFHRQA